MRRKFEIGYRFKDGEIRRENLVEKGFYNISIIYLSDFHFNGYGAELKDFILDSIHDIHPDLILFGGDYVDFQSGYKFLDELFSSVGIKYKCLAIFGNHDYFFGIEKLMVCMKSNNIEFIDEFKIIEINGVSIQIDSKRGGEENFNTDVNILLLHEPISRKKIKKKYDLILAGHLHGCQFKLWEKEGYSYPGAFLYANNFTRSYKQESLYLISKGLGDTLPIRYNCRKEILLINI